MAVHYFDPNGVDSLRDNGYRDTAMALSELLDNSIQANAKKIEIILIEKMSTTGKKEWLVNEIFVVDNGDGMDKNSVETSLRFGGGTRHGASKGLGKFGMGLPNSSASQCKRFEVYSWKKNFDVYFNYFDFKEIRDNKSEFLPEVEKTEFPKHIEEIIKHKSNSGTIVRWVDCDRLILRRTNRLVPHIEWPLGRIFRYFINEKNVDIKIRVFQSTGSSVSEVFALATTIKAVDPLFLMTDTQLKMPYNSQPTNSPWQEGEFLFPDPNGDKENKELFNSIGDSIKIKMSIVKPEIKAKEGGSNTETGLGKIYREFTGISVVREDREIKLDKFGFIIDTSNPTNRFWKIEVNFKPTFDVYFGLDNTKQNVHTFKKYEDKDKLEITDDDVNLKFICKLSEFLETQISAMRGAIDNMGAGSRGGLSTGDGNIPLTGDNGPFPSGAVLVPLLDDNPENIEEEKDEVKVGLKRWLLLRYPEYDTNETKLNLAIDWFFSNEYNQVIVFLQLGAAEFYNPTWMGHRTIIEINTEHDFYLEFIRPIFDEGDLNKIDPMLLLFGAMVEAEKGLVSYQQYIKIFRSSFAVKLNQFILDWKERR
jgi:hypothetical protein